MESRRVLVIGDGDIGAIVASAAAADGALMAEPDAAKRRAIRPVLWTPVFRGETAKARRWASRRQAELFEMELVEPAADEAASAPEGEWPRDTGELVQASIAAVKLGCSTVVWPTHSVHAESPDLDDVSRAVDRALLVARLISLDADHHGCPSFRIETPLVDLSDRMLADLVLDMDLPVRLCWWWHAEMSSGGSGEFLRQHDRWTGVLEAVGWRTEARGERLEPGPRHAAPDAR
ncbi:MAG: hypothetical protein L6Q35_08990 [Phycisphaerales bacterium]|nr:hypothetical protein [Phycisphaerales bacterium]